MYTITTDTCIQDFSKKWGNRYDYSYVEYTNAKTKLKIRCRQHGFFYMNRNDHLNNHGCMTCGKIAMNRKNVKKQKSTFVDGISLFDLRYKKIHATRKKKNNYKSASQKMMVTKRKLLPDGTSIHLRSLQKMYVTKVAKGLYRDPQFDTEWVRFKKEARKHTMTSIKNHGHEIGYNAEDHGRHQNHIDHKLSLIDAFTSGVSAYNAGHICNLQFIPCHENWSKNSKSTIDAVKLLRLIDNFNNAEGN